MLVNVKNKEVNCQFKTHSFFKYERKLYFQICIICMNCLAKLIRLKQSYETYSLNAEIVIETKIFNL